MAINWNNIRPLNNSLNDGFEELVCQLASREIVVGKDKFWRMGKPDAGKECYWILENGDLHMWQAKFFTTSFSATQWTEIDKSVITAIDNHLNLKKYCIAIPIDMPDGKVKGKKSMLDKWKSKTQEWIDYAKTKGIYLTFDFWGSSELITRLSKKENEGIKYFWFNQEEFLDTWFNYKNQESTTALGARYTKDLNVELPIAKLFDGIARDENFKKQSDERYAEFIEKYRDIRITTDNAIIKENLEILDVIINKAKEDYKEIDFDGQANLGFDNIIESLEAAYDPTEKVLRDFYAMRSEKEKKPEPHAYTRPFATEVNAVGKFISAIGDYKDFLTGDTVFLANHPYLLLVGEAGIGKSHLFADVVKTRSEKQQKSLFLLGENFSNRDLPWTQILRNQLRINGIDELVFLSALNAQAESAQTRTVIFIDAINEGEGVSIWPNRLKSFIDSVKSFPWLGLVLSLRSSYERLMAPDAQFDESVILKVKHEGFANYEYEATKRFFDFYGIIEPGTPILNPEFHNPLFLKLFCKSIQAKGLTQIPAGVDGITSIIEFYLDSINTKLSAATELHYDESKKLVHKAVSAVLSQMVDADQEFLSYDNATTTIDSIFSGNCYKPEPFLKKLLSEGVFNKDLRWSDDGKQFEVIYFAYQRFQDHLTVSMLLDKHLDMENPKDSFEKGKLHELLKDDVACWKNQNLIEAFAIQLPERTGREIFELAEHAKSFYQIADAFLNSLIWRKPESIGDAAKDFVNDVIAHDEELFHRFLGTVISASMKPEFYFNAESLHNFLSGFTMADRDETWTIYLQDKYGDNSSTNAVNRLIDWAWKDDVKSHVSDNVMLLACTTLAWFLCSPNRYLRDATTKALICLLENRVHLIPRLLEKFKDVNDSYIFERLYAVAYGCVLRSGKSQSLMELCNYIYDNIFNKDMVIPNILLRDYARGVIEFALHEHLELDFEITKVRPPYKSQRLPVKFPSNKEIDDKFEPDGEEGHYGKGQWGSTAIFRSMTTEYGRKTGGYGDFGRYVFQSALSNWKIDYDGLSNYAVERIFELGYDPKIFSEFDSRQGSGRDGGHNERMGKKYQWIVFNELLARVSDQCELLDESEWDEKGKTLPYDGPWYPNVRDIDPTMIIKETKAERYKKYTPNWWFNTNFNSYASPIKDWLIGTDNLPVPSDILEVADSDGKKWLWLDIDLSWTEPETLGEDKYGSARKKLSYWISSYLVRRSDLVNIEKNFKGDFFRSDLPEIRTMTHVFSREYYWSAAFAFHNKPYYSGEDWIEVYSRKNSKLIGEFHRTSEYFLWEEEYDCSKSDSIYYHKPVQKIKEGLEMKFSKNEGEFVDGNDELVCFDPSVNNKSLTGLLVRKDKLIEWLEKEDLALLWNVKGEKQVLGNWHWKKGEYLGQLQISGLYKLENHEINGKLGFLKAR
ncbi:ATP-binding protein [Flavobacterium petrolei]|uniref:ATP-binding protein n=1 Tax=Flavobacterium petrolei TaxID=2259594 RepID=A0A482TGU0_9FLAO|nr:MULTISPECIES: ATP-binding protein [Flavobacterium]NGY37651.1 ATP-binding protein [Flavobacterium sp. XN-5]RYJ50593.1 ATP-binding protein [Flavobacterium petrolei]